MYIHIGGDYSLFYQDIVGIFDIEVCTISSRTREFLRNAQKKEKVVTVSDDIPKSFIVAEYAGEDKTYITPISPTTLRKRSG